MHQPDTRPLICNVVLTLVTVELTNTGAHASFKAISFHNLQDIQAFSISHYAVLCHSHDHLHIKQILMSQERSKIWKSCK